VYYLGLQEGDVMDKLLTTVERAAGYGIRRTRGRSVRGCCHERTLSSAWKTGLTVEQTRSVKTPMHDQLLTLSEAADILRTPVATLRYWRHLGIGPDGFRVGRRVMYRIDDLDRWIKEQHDAEAGRRPS
jgi:hypothetical protein